MAVIKDIRPPSAIQWQERCHCRDRAPDWLRSTSCNRSRARGGIVAPIRFQTPAWSSEPDDGLHLLRRLCHDVRQELAVIQALVEMAAREPDVPEPAVRRLTQIATQTSYVSEMMRRVVEQTAGLKEVDVAEFVSHVVEDVQLRTGTTCRLEAAPTSLFAEPVLLRRALVNMLDNAVRAAGPSGVVMVRAHPEGTDVVIEIEDSGPGFGRATPGLASLGLDVVHDCAKVHGGEFNTGTGNSGGGSVRLQLPQAPSGRLAEMLAGTTSDAHPAL
jgi:signal transduction histidine kinase